MWTHFNIMLHTIFYLHLLFSPLVSRPCFIRWVAGYLWHTNQFGWWVLTKQTLLGVLNNFRDEAKSANQEFHRLTYPKGVHSFRYFLHSMRTPNLFMHISILSNPFVVCSCIYAFCLRIARMEGQLQFSGKMHICMSRQQKYFPRGSTWMSVHLLGM